MILPEKTVQVITEYIQNQLQAHDADIAEELAASEDGQYRIRREGQAADTGEVQRQDRYQDSQRGAGGGNRDRRLACPTAGDVR